MTSPIDSRSKTDTVAFQPDSFWHGKRVFITGHTGFIGSWLSAYFLENQAKVIGYSNQPFEEPSVPGLTQNIEKLETYIGDIRDFENIQGVLENVLPDIVLHTAAQPIVKQAIENPRETFEINIIGLLNVLESLKNIAKTKVLINLSTFQCYKTPSTGIPLIENDPSGYENPYAASKYTAECLLSSYRRTFFENQGILSASVRVGSVIGDGDKHSERLLPMIADCLLSGKEIVIRQPGAMRSWVHVCDLVNGVASLGKAIWDGKTADILWNMGGCDFLPITVADIVEQSIAFWGSGRYRVESRAEIKSEPLFFKINSEKARTALGWKPIATLEEMIKKTLRPFRDRNRNFTPV
jgi:CDP-glucose 4,6-dehydratase